MSSNIVNSVNTLNTCSYGIRKCNIIGKKLIKCKFDNYYEKTDCEKITKEFFECMKKFKYCHQSFDKDISYSL